MVFLHWAGFSPVAISNFARALHTLRAVAVYEPERFAALTCYPNSRRTAHNVMEPIVLRSTRYSQAETGVRRDRGQSIEQPSETKSSSDVASPVRTASKKPSSRLRSSSSVFGPAQATRTVAAHVTAMNAV